MPKPLSEEARQRIIGAVAMGAGLALAADMVGCSRQTIYNWMDRDPEFKREIDAARAKADDLVEQSLYHTAMKGNVTAQIFWLKNRRSAIWRDRHDVATSGEINVRITRDEGDE